MKSLKGLVEETYVNTEMRKAIRACVVVLQMQTEKPSKAFDIGIVTRLKTYYKGLDFNTLLALWHDAYDTVGIKKISEKEITSHYLLRHKIVAIGLVIDEADRAAKQTETYNKQKSEPYH